MKLKLCVLMVAVFSISCSSLKTDRQEVVIDDGSNTTREGEVVLEDRDIKYIPDLAAKKKSSQEEFTAPDGSRITVMIDAYGNKSETRYFNNDPKLEMILLRTSVSGQKQVYVYAQNGEVKDLPPDMIDRVLTSSASEIAGAAGIYEGRKQDYITKIFTGMTSPRNTEPLLNKNIQTESQTTENTLPQTETREETKQSESPVNKNSEQTKEPVRFSENFQNLIPKKRKNLSN